MEKQPTNKDTPTLFSHISMNILLNRIINLESYKSCKGLVRAHVSHVHGFGEDLDKNNNNEKKIVFKSVAAIPFTEVDVPRSIDEVQLWHSLPGSLVRRYTKQEMLFFHVNGVTNGSA